MRRFVYRRPWTYHACKRAICVGRIAGIAASVAVVEIADASAGAAKVAIHLSGTFLETADAASITAHPAGSAAFALVEAADHAAGHAIHVGAFVIDPNYLFMPPARLRTFRAPPKTRGSSQ